MTTGNAIAAAIAVALASVVPLPAEAAGHEHQHGGAHGEAQEAPRTEMPPHGPMMGGRMMGGRGMMAEGPLPPEMVERMQARMEEVMRPMLRDIIREVMLEIEREGVTAPGDPAGADQHAHHGDDAASGSPSTRAFRAANAAMHAAMEIDFTDDADIDFARGMIGHHEGAIAMARILLEHGADEELRQLAEEIIETQEAEIAFLRDWLARHAE
jgi:uncharacterized protein (DUF305 family)